MRLTLLCLILTICVARISRAQTLLDRKVDFSISQTSVPEALNQLATQSNISIDFSSRFFRESPPVSGSFQQETVGNVLTELLKNTETSFKSVGERILIFQQKTKQFTFSGVFLERFSQEPLLGAAVYCPATKTGAYTNEYGFFSLTLPEGEYEIQFRYVGYAYKTVTVSLHENIRQTVFSGESRQLEDVVIMPELPDTGLIVVDPLQGTRIDGELVENAPALGGATDYVRAAQLLPGVQGAVDGSAGLHVRGGDPGHNLMLLDGAPVFIPYHLLGAYSVYNSRVVKAAYMSRGRFSARYGSRLNSVYDVRVREGDRQKLVAGAGVNLSMAEAFVEGPIVKEKASFLVSGRFAPGSPLLNPVFSRMYFPNETGTLETNFHDILAKFNWQIGQNDRIFVSFFQGSDKFEKEYEGESQNETLDTEAKLNWSNATAALRWNHLFSSKLFANTTATYSRFEYRYTSYDAITSIDSSVLQTLFFSDSRSLNTQIGVQSDFDWFASADHKVRFGGGVFLPVFNPVLNVLTESSSEVTNLDTLTLAALESLSESEHQEVLEGNFYLEDEWSLSNRVMVEMGVRGSFFKQDDDVFLNPEPRLGLTVKPAKNIAFYGYGSRMIQYLHLIHNTSLRFPNDIWLTSGEFLKPQESWMVEAGISARPHPAVSLSLDLYRKQLNNLYSLSDSVSDLTSSTLATPDSFLVEGTGEAHGLEFMANFSRRRTHGLLSYALSEATRQFDGINLGKPFPHAFDRRHQLSIYLSHRISRASRIGLTWTYMSGNPQLALTAVETGLGFTPGNLYAPGEKNSRRTPAYHRLDVNFSTNLYLGRTQHTLKIGVYNCYNRDNISWYRIQPTGLESIRSIGITPGFEYTVRFGRIEKPEDLW